MPVEPAWLGGPWAAPEYIRDKVAQTTEERMAAKAAQVQAAAALTGQPGNESQASKTGKSGQAAQTAHDEGTR